jgi:AhpD family alkylhydroperoxidase
MTAASAGVGTTPIEYQAAPAEVRAVYDDIMATRNTDWVNNYWKVLANHPPTLQRMWANVKQVMAAGALDSLTKELIYIAVSVTNGCHYCIASHSAAARNKGLTPEQYAELVAVIGLANETNRHAVALDLQIDPQFRAPSPAT